MGVAVKARDGIGGGELVNLHPRRAKNSIPGQCDCRPAAIRRMALARRLAFKTCDLLFQLFNHCHRFRQITAPERMIK